MRIWSSPWRDRLLPGLSLTGLVILLRITGFFQPPEWRAFDLSLKWQPAEATDTRITIVEITEEDIQNELDYPISDQALANLLQTLQAYQPRVIGVDIFRDRPIGEGQAALNSVLKANRNIIGINKIDGTTDVQPHPALLESQVGFADALVDDDGYLRRSFLGSADTAGNYRFSLTVRLVEQYLAPEGISLENGIQDPETMRFGSVEIPRLQPNTGGYNHVDNGGNQTLINFRAGPTPFTRVTYAQVVANQVDPALLQDRIVLVGYTAESVKDFVSSTAIVNNNPSLIPGVVIQAHAASQILSAAYEGRPFIKSLPEIAEYLFILVGGLLGIAIALWQRRPTLHLLIAIALITLWLLACYSLLIASWWLPLVPVLAAFSLNALGLYPLHQAQARLTAQIEERKNLINWTYNTIHNGPLQLLAGILSSWPAEEPLQAEARPKLETLNKELRNIDEAMRQEMLLTHKKLVMTGQRTIDLEVPLETLLYETYQGALARQPDFFKQIVQITTFEPMPDKSLSSQQKRELARFLEEALINIYKHAKAVTRLHINCLCEKDTNVIRVVDNGRALPTKQQESRPHEAYGTQQAKRLARQLSGHFERVSLQPSGIRCELRWPANPNIFQQWFS